MTRGSNPPPSAKEESMKISRIKENTKELDNGCWEWDKSCNSAGYGQLTENKKYWLAHRYAYQCVNKDLSDDEVVRHLCHNTKCCNPEHLVKGSHADNWNDSREAHMKASEARRKVWKVLDKTYQTIREANLKTGISMNSLVKFTVDGIFDVESYRDSCEIARVQPKI